MAIAFDAGTYAQSTTGTSLTFSHTTSGTDRILFVMGSDKASSATVVTGVTYNGVAMTQVNTLDGAAGQNDRAITLWYLINPASGANDVVVSASESVTLRFSAVSYTGAEQANQPDGSDTSVGSTVTSISTDITTTDSNSWMLMFTKDINGGLTYSNSTGDTIRLNTDAAGHCITDTGAAIAPAGSNTITNTMSSTTLGALAVSFSSSNFEIDTSDTFSITEAITVAKQKLISVSDTFTTADTLVVLPYLVASDTFTITEDATFTESDIWTNRTQPSITWTDLDGKTYTR